MADYFTGLVGYAVNSLGSSNPKQEIVNYLKCKLDKNNLCLSTSLFEDKFNIFVWDNNA